LNLPKDTFRIRNELVKFKKCRHCNHWHHSSNNFTWCDSYIVSGRDLLLIPGNMCFCQELPPEDNLEYLEYLYEQKVKTNV
jgi:hypothetical protein